MVQLPRDWFGPRDELVALRPDGPPPDTPPSQPPTGEPGPNGARAPMAVDFWGGVAAPDELVPFPAGSSEGLEGGGDDEHQPERRASAVARSRATARLRAGIHGRGRRAAVGLTILFLGLVAVRTFVAQSTRAHPGARSDKIAQVGHSGQAIDFRDEPRPFGQRRLASARQGRTAVRRPRAIKQGHASRGPSQRRAAPTSHHVADSPPATTQSATSYGTSTSSSGSASAGSGSGGGDQGSTAGPTGPGAAFGPGQLRR